MEFKFLLPSKVVMEPGLRERTGEHLRALGLSRILIVTDPGVKAAGLLDSVYASLDKAGIAFEEVADIKANPRSEDINQTAQQYRGQGIDGLLAVGGGSAMDAAKAISVLLTHDGRIEDYEGSFTLTRAIPPIVAIPTTAGTGSEVTCFSVITDTARHFKMSVHDHRVGPVLALLDSHITDTLPASIAAATGMDALTHAIEAYTCRVSNPISDGLALHAIRLISQHLKPAVQEPENREAREQMLVASLIAGMAFGNADVGSVHCISEAIGGMYDTPHGVGNAIFLPFVFGHNRDANIVRHAQVAYALGIDPGLSPVDAAEAAVSHLFQMSKELGIPRFADVRGVREEDFPSLAENAKQNFSDASNAKTMSVQAYHDIITTAYHFVA
ncbi:TPA: iron-containing alcohol dehydrogenase [Pseudomonas aeruginosa]|jgi:alcohol dehydrogenase|uniref:iron-containing alcohol dehydrogenase n=1 Tax=Pseudomonas aeruginosa TaxID=287 RepID=UPI0009397CC5|nr:iron-containing alcohol dehydrogenase [Pseudomonas aeruginosa]KAB0779241.1 iron-containing alcohol dehydrogenase [Pseudomonas aeruginosa]MBG6404220.1 iron-containing alcohol dehydrogenase [Pseudomonas aeruginosa]MBH4125903.1 iron-containing alcohol dehydrogenase [Pseudomonas aeruginosa]MBH4248650.1 iron-containing alcohol dehydrogenase [Pseudomonas aeruginosa]MBI7997276.1 iron-containing alcohol dehydrogenase [Pseudomonas aeruginosa]